MINLTTLYDNIYDVIYPKLRGYDLVLQDEVSGREAESYLSYKIKSWQQLGTSHQSRTDNTWTSTTTVETYWKICINFVSVGTKSEEIALILASELNKVSFINQMSALGLGFLYKNDIKYVPKLLTTDIESRHLIECYFNTILTDTDTTGYIQSAEVEGVVKDDVGNIIYNETTIITAP